MERTDALLDVAKTSPHLLTPELAQMFDRKQGPEDRALSLLLFNLIENNPADEVSPILSDLINLISQNRGPQSAFNVVSRIEVVLGFRKPSLGIYDNAFHFIGGAQKYGCTIAHALQDEFDITLIANTDISHEQLEGWYNLDLSSCRIKILKIPYFQEKEKRKGVFDAGEVDLKGDNPFRLISKDSGNYDIFINNCMLEMVYPLANISEFVCHFPERQISRFFHVDKYTHIIYNSLYTAKWIKKRWNLEPHVHIYPPVDMETTVDPENKKNIILSASRFEVGGNKQQIEMIKAFVKLSHLYPDILNSWRLVLVGGSVPENPYLDKVNSLLSSLSGSKIDLKVNISADELRKIYREAKIFWHFSGYKQRDPARFEHFGMTTVEAMQNRCVPVVFDGGGLGEIVEHHVSGYLFTDMAGMTSMTFDLIQNPSSLAKMSEGAYAKGKKFTKEAFVTRVREHFSRLLREYSFQHLKGE